MYLSIHSPSSHLFVGTGADFDFFPTNNLGTQTSKWEVHTTWRFGMLATPQTKKKN